MFDAVSLSTNGRPSAGPASASRSIASITCVIDASSSFLGPDEELVRDSDLPITHLIECRKSYISRWRRSFE